MKSVFDYAKYFMKKDLDNIPNTYDGNMKLQKLLVFANLVSLAINDKPLFDAPIYAFEYGCVIESIRVKYKEDYSSFHSESKLFDPDFTEDECTVLNTTADIFGKLSARELSELNHTFNFWNQSYKKSIKAYGFKDKELSVVSIESMKKEICKIKKVLTAYNESQKNQMKREIVNGIVFYIDPLLDVTDDILNELEAFSWCANDNAYSVYSDESAGLVIY